MTTLKELHERILKHVTDQKNEKSGPKCSEKGLLVNAVTWLYRGK
jgi:hypothetical protein